MKKELATVLFYICVAILPVILYDGRQRLIQAYHDAGRLGPDSIYWKQVVLAHVAVKLTICNLLQAGLTVIICDSMPLLIVLVGHLVTLPVVYPDHSGAILALYRRFLPYNFFFWGFILWPQSRDISSFHSN